MTGRRIAIAYTGFASGRGLLQFARDKLLNPNDEIYLVHVFNKQENPVRNGLARLSVVTTIGCVLSGQGCLHGMLRWLACRLCTRL